MKILKESKNIIKEDYDMDEEDLYSYTSIGELRIPIKIRTEFPASQVGENGATFVQIKNAIHDEDFLERIKDSLNQVFENNDFNIYHESYDNISTILEYADTDTIYIKIESTI